MTRDPAPLTVLPRLPDGLEVLPRPADDAGFGKLRALGLGGTDIAAILGQDPRRTAFDVWLRKTGLHEETPLRDAGAAWGLRLESAIAAWWGSERGLPVTMPGVTIRLKAHPWALGNPDAWALRPEETEAPVEVRARGPLFGAAEAPPPEPVGLADCKLRHPYGRDGWGEPGTSDVPFATLVQCHWYLALHEGALPWCDVPVTFGGFDDAIYRLEYDAEVSAELLSRAEDWWRRYVVAGVEPERSGESVDGWLKARFPRPTSSEIRRASDEEERVALRYAVASRELEAAKARKEAARVALLEAIGESSGIQGDAWRATWKTRRGYPRVAAKDLVTELLRGSNLALDYVAAARAAGVTDDDATLLRQAQLFRGACELAVARNTKLVKEGRALRADFKDEAFQDGEAERSLEGE